MTLQKREEGYLEPFPGKVKDKINFCGEQVN
jgi:hypothetical protein